MAVIDYVPSLLEIGRVRSRQRVRYRAVDLWLDVCPQPRESGRRAHTGVPPWRENRDGKLDADGIRRSLFFGAVRQLVPPPQGQKPPSLWGSEDHLRQLFGDPVTLEVKPQHFVFRYRSPAHWIEVFSTTFGPVMKALEALDDPGRERLRLELHRVIGEFSKATDGTMVVPSEYLEVVATKS